MCQLPVLGKWWYQIQKWTITCFTLKGLHFCVFQFVITRITWREESGSPDRHTSEYVCNQASLGKTALFYFIHVLLRRLFILLRSEYGDCGKREKPSVSTATEGFRITELLVQFQRGQCTRMCWVHHSTLHQSRKPGRPYLITLTQSFRQKGCLKGEHDLAQGCH